MSINSKIRSPLKQKILLLLQVGLALGLSRSPRHHWYIYKQLPRVWRRINRQYLYKVVSEFKYKRLIEIKEDKDGRAIITLSEKGKKMVLAYHIDQLVVKKPLRWDKKWRAVFFDIPEKKRGARDTLRTKLKEMEFHEMQKSVFIHPYPCLKEINFIVEFYGVRDFVRYAELSDLTNDAEYRLVFDLV